MPEADALQRPRSCKRRKPCKPCKPCKRHRSCKQDQPCISCKPRKPRKSHKPRNLCTPCTPCIPAPAARPSNGGERPPRIPRAKRSAAPGGECRGAMCPAASIVAAFRPLPALRCGGTPPHFSGVALKWRAASRRKAPPSGQRFAPPSGAAAPAARFGGPWRGVQRGTVSRRLNRRGASPPPRVASRGYAAAYFGLRPRPRIRGVGVRRRLFRPPASNSGRLVGALRLPQSPASNGGRLVGALRLPQGSASRLPRALPRPPLVSAAPGGGVSGRHCLPDRGPGAEPLGPRRFTWYTRARARIQPTKRGRPWHPN